jgi:flap endonuclease-1
MGIHGLGTFLKKNTNKGIDTLDIRQLQDKSVAIDTSIILYQYMIAMKSNDLKTSTGKSTVHIHAILMKTLSLLKKKIKPVYVFDGSPPNIKKNILENRKKNKNKAIDIITDINNKLQNNNNNETDIENLEKEKEKYSKRVISISSEQIEECKEIIKLLGIPIIESLEEADSQCAWLIKNNYVDYIASEDMDLLTFGTTKLLRGLNSKNNITLYTLDKILNELKLTHKQFINLCILLGCDYCPKIKKIGPKKAFELILKYKSINNILENEKNIQSNDDIDYQSIESYFINPPVNKIKSNQITWCDPDFDKLKKLLVDKYEYNQDKLNLLFNTLKGGYYPVICGSKTKDQYYNEKREYFRNINNNVCFDD